MSKSPATREFARRERPLSPHLTVYRPPITMTMSIIHRITGGALYFGTLLVAVWLMARPADVPNAAAQAWMNLRLRIGIDVSWVTVSERLDLARRIDLVFSLPPAHLIRALGRRSNSSPEVNHDSDLR